MSEIIRENIKNKKEITLKIVFQGIFWFSKGNKRIRILRKILLTRMVLLKDVLGRRGQGYKFLERLQKMNIGKQVVKFDRLLENFVGVILVESYKQMLNCSYSQLGSKWEV